MKRAILILSAALLTACVGAGPSREPGAAVPVSEQTTNPNDILQKSAKTHTELGTLYMQAGNMAVAMEEARMATMIDPGYAPGFSLMGLGHMMLNEMPLARQAFERAIQLAPGDPQIANDYGWFLCQNGQERDAMKYLESAARNPLYKTPTRPYANMGLCYLRLKDEKNAEANFQRAVMLDSANVQAIYHLASLAYGRGDYASARKRLGELHRLMDPNAESLWLGIRIERKAGDRQAEADYAAQLRRKFANSPEYQALQEGKYE